MQGFESVYRAYFTDVYRYALSLCGDTALADDLTSECFLKAMRAIGSFRGECELRVWLCQILKRLYLDHLRRDGRELPSDTLPEHGESPDPAEVFTQEDQAMRAHRALRRLPEPYREVFSLRVLGGLGFAAIGELFSKSQNWACVTYHRARQKLRDIMEDEL